MIKNILTLLRQFDYMVGSESIDIAKGKYELTYNFREVYKQKQRTLISNKVNRDGRN
jgi:hypothetical protein